MAEPIMQGAMSPLYCEGMSSRKRWGIASQESY